MQSSKKVISLETVTLSDIALKSWIADTTKLDLSEYTIEAVERDAQGKSTTAIFRKESVS